jgi:HSP20 family protein
MYKTGVLEMVKRLDREDGVNNLFDQMHKMFNQMQNFSKDLDFRTSVPVDIKEEDGKVVLTADIPGVQKDDINLKADEDTVEISAESSQELKEENEKYVRRERSSKSFRRVVSWPTKINAETIHAEYNDGVLHVEAEKKDNHDGDSIEIE